MSTAPGSARLKIGSARLTTGGNEREVIWWTRSGRDIAALFVLFYFLPTLLFSMTMLFL